ncbi:MAG: hypothetical protein ACRBF0_02910 [Calditrichia bacterium]
MNKHAILFLCIVLLGASSFAQPLTGKLGRQVISADQIREAGILRMTGLLRLVDDWYATSVDDYVEQLTAGNLASFENQHWEVLVDGQPVYLGVLTAIDLNALPVGIAMIDSVEFFSTPQLVHSRFSDRGLIHIHTSVPKQGFSYSNLTWYGNETGDPGPFIFTERSSRNIDRVGPDYSNFLSYRYGKIALRAGLLDQNHYSTDGRLRERNPGRANSDLWLRRYLPSLQINFPAFGGSHKFLLLHNSTRGFAGNKLNGSNPLFFAPLGGEIPTTRIATSSGLSGEVGADTTMVLRYKLRLSRDRIFEEVEAPLVRRIDWELDVAHASLESLLKRKNYRATVGVLWQRAEPSSGYFFGADNYTTSAIFASVVLKPFRGFRQATQGQLTTNNNQSSLKLATGVTGNVKRQQIELQLSYSERLLSENNDLWFWQDQQLRLLQANGVELFEDGIAGKSRTITFDGSWQTAIFKKIQLRAEGFYRSLANLTISEQEYTYNGPRLTAGDITLVHEQRGRLAGMALKASTSFAGKWNVRGSYRYYGVIDGTSLFRQRQKEIPERHARVEINWRPVENFTIQSAMNYRAATFWKQYDVLGKPFAASTKSFLTSDIALHKHFWKRRLRGSLIMQNLFNDEQRVHPLGGQLDLNYYLQLSVTL